MNNYHTLSYDVLCNFLCVSSSQMLLHLYLDFFIRGSALGGRDCPPRPYVLPLPSAVPSVPLHHLLLSSHAVPATLITLPLVSIWTCNWD